MDCIYVDVLYNIYKCCKTFDIQKSTFILWKPVKSSMRDQFDFKKYIEKVRGYTVVFIRLSLVAGDSE